MGTRSLLAAAALAFLAAMRVDAASMYTITDLGTLPGTTTSIATGINDLGQVVGYSNNSIGISPVAGSQSFLYSGGQLTSIGNPSLNDPAGGINNSGQVVGVGQFVNNSGQVVGGPFQVPYNGTVNGVTTTLQATFSPVGINDSGQIAGTISRPLDMGGGTDAAIYQNGKVFDVGKALGLTDTTSVAVGIDRAGDVLLYDYHRADNTSTYMIYKADGTSQVLTMGGPATAINSAGQVVGSGQVVQDGGGVTGSGVLYTNGKYLSLPDLLPPSSQSFWTTLDPTAINDEGQIVGFGGTIGGPTHAFLMTPTTPTPAPEPSTSAVLAAAIVAFSLREWARRRGQR